ncbi:hypothetical protein BGZ88_003351 [Linnemannia elongata]|nr:hypothetical protein BGZ88_003351 [Linnemannia elongata]
MPRSRRRNVPRIGQRCVNGRTRHVFVIAAAYPSVTGARGPTSSADWFAGKYLNSPVEFHPSTTKT